MIDKLTTLEHLKNKVDSFRKKRNWVTPQKDLAISIAIEAAQLLENFQWDDYKDNLDKKRVHEELADVLIYCLEFAIENNIDISTAIEKKLKKNDLKYPVKLVKNNGKKYYELKKAHREKSKNT